MQRMTSQEIHQELFEALCEIDRICKKNNIPYWLGFGSLLGAARHEGFIPWDDDMDLWMMREDWDRFNKIVSQELKEKYYAINQYTRKNYPAWSLVSRVSIKGTYRHHSYFKDKKEYKSGIYIDIFPLENISQRKMLQKIQQKLLRKIDEILICKTQTKESSLEILGRKYYFGRIPASFMTVYKWNQLRSILQKGFGKKDSRYVMVPMGPRGKYPLEKILYKREYFGRTKALNFCAYHEEERKNFPAPGQYEKILRRTYCDWKRIPQGKKEKGVSYWTTNAK